MVALGLDSGSNWSLSPHCVHTCDCLQSLGAQVILLSWNNAIGGDQ